eukprot:scaffold149755_cov22-Tisochrysis_lutea.AAC.2
MYTELAKLRLVELTRQSLGDKAKGGMAPGSKQVTRLEVERPKAANKVTCQKVGHADKQGHMPLGGPCGQTGSHASKWA